MIITCNATCTASGYHALHHMHVTCTTPGHCMHMSHAWSLHCMVITYNATCTAVVIICMPHGQFMFLSHACHMGITLLMHTQTTHGHHILMSHGQCTFLTCTMLVVVMHVRMNNTCPSHACHMESTSYHMHVTQRYETQTYNIVVNNAHTNITWPSHGQHM